MSDDLHAAEALEALRSIGADRIEYKADVTPAVLDVSDREVTTLFSVDNLDSTGDITQVAAFKRSIDNRAQSIPHLYMHDLTAPAIARILSFQEVKRAELPTDVQLLYPDATGGMACVSRYLSRGRGAEVLEGIKEGIPYQASFGYQVIKAEQKALRDGRKARIIKELKLFEISTTPPGHAANDATRTRMGKALALLEELKIGWRHGTQSEIASLIEILMTAHTLLGTNSPLVELAPQTTEAARTSEVDQLISDLEVLYSEV